ncbi:MAG TPA: arylsulfatase A, partial [Bacteroidales bacterium]|nr:arylsulfatase A [Bacteroidales bacterium]
MKLEVLTPVLLSSLAVIGCSKDKENKPNVILVMADDMGYECLSCYGGLSYKTPVLDSLASHGMLFGQCHSQPLSTPS